MRAENYHAPFCSHCIRYISIQLLLVRGLYAAVMMALGVGGERGKALQAIVQALHHSSELEAWGLMVEASEEFQK